MNACIEESIDEVSEKDLVLTRLNEGREVGTIRVTKAELVEASDEIPEAPPISTSSIFGDSLNGVPRSTGSMNGAPVSAHSLNDSFAGSVTSDLNESFASAPCEILLPPMIEDTPRMTRPRFKEYVDSGCEIDLCFAVDFTSSNGESIVTRTIENCWSGLCVHPSHTHQSYNRRPTHSWDSTLSDS